MSEPNTDMPCPHCEGGTAFWYSLPSPTRPHDRGSCHVCKDTGKVTAEHYERIVEGKRRYKDRVSRGVSLREEAARLGIHPRDLGDIEHGRVPTK